MFYKGYSPTKDKKCQIKFKDVPSSELYSFEDVQSLPEYAGILAADSILIDIDDMEQSKMLLDIVDAENIRCKVLQSRSGMHFLFKNSKVEKCYTSTKLACGLVADIKSGFKNCYEVLKIEGKERTVLYDIFEDEEYQELPKWLFPVKCNSEFLDMNAGDGRNQALFNYILTLQSNDFSVEEARETIEIINKYVLKDPLPDDELAVVLRDDSFKKPIFFKGNNFLFDKFATYIKNNNHIIRVNGQLHLFKDGVYIPGQEEIEAVMIRHISNLSNAKRSEVWKYLNLILLENTQMATPNLIAFRNGIYNVHTGELNPFSPDVVITNRIPWDYNPNAYSELADKTLDKIACNDEQVRTILEECIGSCFYRSNELRKAFFFTGSGSNGKSTFIFILQRILGEENISALDLKELSEKFQNAELFGKLANLGDDISSSFNPDINIFKKITGGNRFQVQRKGERPFEFNPFCKLVFSANTMPRMNEKTKALTDRLLIIPFEARFTSDDADFDPKIKWKLQQQDAIEYFIRIGIEGLKRVIISNRYTISAKMQKELDEYEITNNPLLSFIQHCKDEEITIVNESVSRVYENYSSFCRINNYQPLANNEFSKQLQRSTDLTTTRQTVNKRKKTIFIKQE